MNWYLLIQLKINMKADLCQKLVLILKFRLEEKKKITKSFRLRDNAILNFSKGADSVMTGLLNNKNYLEKNVVEELGVY